MTQRPLGNDPGTSVPAGDPQTFSAWDPAPTGANTVASSTGSFSASGSSDSGLQDPYGSTSSEGSSAGGVSAAADAAKGEAKQVTETVVESGKQVAQTAKEQVASVASETKDQAVSLISTFRTEVGQQVSTQQSRIADAIHGLAKELGGLASSSDQSGPLTDLAQEASRRGGEIAHWLQEREPADVIDSVRSYARRRPLTFLALCGLAGVVAGRLSRSAAATHTSLDSPGSAGGSSQAALSSGSYGQYSAPAGSTYGTTPSTYGNAGSTYGTAGSGYGTAGGSTYGTTGAPYDSGTTYESTGTTYGSGTSGSYTDPNQPFDGPSGGPTR